MIVQFKPYDEQCNPRLWYITVTDDKLIIAKIKEMFDNVSVWQRYGSIFVQFFNNADHDYFKVLMINGGLDVE